MTGGLVSPDRVIVKTDVFPQEFIDSFVRRLSFSIVTGCWEWSGVRNHLGYGEISTKPYRNKHTRAHQVSWIIYCGDIPRGMFVCHSCDNPACCNPDHLFLGTPRENSLDKTMKGRHRNGSKKKITPDIVRDIRLCRSSGAKVKEIAKRFSVSVLQVEKIVQGKSYVWVE